MKTIQYKDMGARIRAQRERLGYTREQLADLLCLRTDYILFGDEQPEHTAELEMMDALIQKCPADRQDDLLTIIHAFIHAVSEPQEPTE